MLGICYRSINDVGPALNQHWFYVSRLTGKIKKVAKRGFKQYKNETDIEPVTMHASFLSQIS